MNGEELLDKIGDISPEYIEEAASKPEKKNIRVKWTALAACLCIVIAGMLFLRFGNLKDPANQQDNTAADGVDVNDDDEIENAGQTDGQIPDDTGEDEEEENKEGLYIPRMDLPDTVTSTMDMEALIVYKGGIYTKSQTYNSENIAEAEHLVGEYLGRAVGTINEWSKQDEYTQEFASTGYGDVYTVNGYDESFRICIIEQYATDGEEGLEIHNSINFYDRLNDIYLANGEDLFEDRLYVKERLVSVQWRSHNGKELNDATFDESIWNAFLDEVYKGEFVCTYMFDENDPDSGFYEGKPYSSIYNTPNQVYLKLNMSDGTYVGMRLIEGGYVGLDRLGNYFVKIPGENFDAIYEACGGTHITDW